jgi:SpoVK/Ycf46/Vps4 family AAA+-type ATPase
MAEINYKFKDIRVYGSNEWLANDEKKYRVVFDETECSFIYCELSFYNKLFDERDWDIKINLKCYDSKSTEMCDLQVQKHVAKEDNIVYVREGWGVKKIGGYWKRGAYRWEAWLDGVLIGSKSFYIEKEGKVTELFNPYFRIKNIRLYEGPNQNVEESKRVYYDCFKQSETRYVWVEFQAENLVKKYDYWACELFFNFKNDTGQLKGSVERMLFVYKNDDMITCTVGWGSDHKGTWGGDQYSIEVLFMDQIVAGYHFDVGEEFIESDEDNYEPFVQTPIVHEHHTEEEQQPENLDSVMHKLDDLIGLATIKTKIKEYSSYLSFLKIRKEKGFDDTDKINLHSVFTGNPGTGKTTVALMLGKIYKSLGLLSKGHVHEVDRADLVAEYIGQTAPKVKEAIKKAKGGILFIDEAYSLARAGDDNKDFGKEVIEIVIKEMSDGDGDIAIIVAGYPEEMNMFLNSNPGLKSRFNMYFEFPDYLPQELMEIAKYCSKNRNVKFTPEADALLYKKLVEAYRSRTNTFGNARYVNSLIDEAKMNLGLRVMALPNYQELNKEQLSTIELADIEKIFASKKRAMADIPVDDELLKESLAKLNSMVGLRSVKTEIDELVKLVLFYREIGKDVRQTFSLHTVFKGSPGTGKTTVARILAHIFKALGILERGNLVETDRQGLVANYVGQTATKTSEMIDKAMGGVLFVDEAYALSQGGESDFGKEAIETLLKRMEDRRGDFILIAAGYTDNMNVFLEFNPGLKSRFDREMVFEDYSPEELMEIANSILLEKEIKAKPEAEEHLKKYFQALYETKDKYFGNGRLVRKVMEDAIKHQHLRLSQVPAASRNPEMMKELTIEDVNHFKIEETDNKGKTSPIGFRVVG